MEELELDVVVEAKRIEDVLMAAARVDVRKMARLLASKRNAELPGETEFRVRDIAHHIGAKGVDAALSERKKGVPGDQRKLSALPGGRAVRRVPRVPASDSAGRNRGRSWRSFAAGSNRRSGRCSQRARWAKPSATC